jgi:hypothetical protein
MMWLFVLIIGAGLIVFGLVSIAKTKGEPGESWLRFPGVEFKSSSPPLMIIVLGGVLIVYAAKEGNPLFTWPNSNVNGIVSAPGGQGWFVQCAAMQVRTNAVSAVVQLSSKGFKAFVVEPPKGDLFYRVYIGPFKSESEAVPIMARIQKDPEFAKAKVVFFK